LATKPLVTEERREVEMPPAALPTPATDIRATRPYFLSRTPLRAAARRLASATTLLFLDIAGLALGLYAALALREVYHGKDLLWGILWKAEQEWLPFVALVTVLVFWKAGLYADRERRAGGGRVISSLVLSALLVVAFALGVGHDFNTFGFVPTALVCSAALVGLFRATYETVTRDVLRVTGVKRRVVLVGKADHLAELHRALGFGRGGIEYEFLGVVAPSGAGVPLPLLGDLEALEPILAARRVDELILADSDFGERQLLEIVEGAHRAGVKVRVAPRTTELLTQSVDYVPEQGLPLFELRPPVFAGADWVVKRAFDLVVSGLVIVLGAPFWLLIAAGIKLTSRGPVLYRDLRVGLHEREFPMLKFRTMIQGADTMQLALERANEASGALFKIREDPRLTRFGAFLRRFSLDEIPQVINVLRGEMSLVGPRPLPVRDYQQLEDWHRKRYLVLPGMTGLWQIAGRSHLTFDDLVRLDFYYLENWSIWLDISILLKTVPAVVAGRGAY
jgi:exopolysaccharide biosynthesis polyprenyl glycosylphosphotransferase